MSMEVSLRYGLPEAWVFPCGQLHCLNLFVLVLFFWVRRDSASKFGWWRVWILDMETFLVLLLTLLVACFAEISSPGSGLFAVLGSYCLIVFVLIIFVVSATDRVLLRLYLLNLISA